MPPTNCTSCSARCTVHTAHIRPMPMRPLSTAEAFYLSIGWLLIEWACAHENSSIPLFTSLIVGISFGARVHSLVFISFLIRWETLAPMRNELNWNEPTESYSAFQPIPFRSGVSKSAAQLTELVSFNQFQNRAFPIVISTQLICAGEFVSFAFSFARNQWDGIGIENWQKEISRFILLFGGLPMRSRGRRVCDFESESEKQIEKWTPSWGSHSKNEMISFILINFFIKIAPIARNFITKLNAFARQFRLSRYHATVHRTSVVSMNSIDLSCAT